MAQFDVGSASALQAALGAATGGDVIRLLPGNYGDVSISSKSFSAQVQIVSADGTSPAVLHSLSISSSSNLLLQGLTISEPPTATTAYASSAVTIVNSNNITLSHSTLVGGPAVNGVDPAATILDATGNVLGLPTGRGIFVNGSDSIVVDTVDIGHFGKGIVLNASTNLTIRGGAIHDVRTSGIDGAAISHLTIDGEHIYNATPWQWGSGDHADYIHLWTDSNTQTTPNTYITISNNLIEQGTGTAILGINLQDRTPAIGYTNVAIQNNVILSGNTQGIRLENVVGSAIQGNVLLQTSGGAKAAPGLVFGSGTSGNDISNNVLASISGLLKTDLGPNSVHENSFVQMVNPDLAGFYGSGLVSLLHALGGGAGAYAGAVAGLQGTSLAEAITQFYAAESVVTHAAVAGQLIVGDYGTRVLGAGGNDTLDGSQGSETLVGGGGDDTYYVPNSTTVVVEQAGDGNDTIVAKGNYTLPANVENLLINSTVTNSWSGTGNGLDNHITGNAGDNVLDGGAGNDTLDGGVGNDTLLGGSGDDVLIGGAGNDSFVGGDGNDSIDSGPGAATVDAGAGDDTISGGDGVTYLRGGDGNDLIRGGAAFNDINGNAGNDTIFGGQGNDWLVGGKGDDSIVGGGGNQILYGNLGNDTILGGAGGDTIRGGQGDDVLVGGSGADWISGDLGNNTLSGGAGADTFHASSNGGIDQVLDFNFAEGDRVQLDAGTAYTVAQVGADTVINLGSGHMTLVGVQASTLGAGWIFGA